MKTKLPPKFEHIGPKSCASCFFVTKNQKTRTAFCQQHSFTFFLYESAMNYVCADHTPLMGSWAKLRDGVIVEESK